MNHSLDTFKGTAYKAYSKSVATHDNLCGMAVKKTRQLYMGIEIRRLKSCGYKSERLTD